MKIRNNRNRWVYPHTKRGLRSIQSLRFSIFNEIKILFYFRKWRSVNNNPRLVWGFTLLELMIAVGLFVVLVTIGVGGFVHALHTQGQVAALISANTNMSLVLEQMAREIRTSSEFCENLQSANWSNPCDSGGSDICFFNARSEVVSYGYNSLGTIFRGVATSSPTDPQKECIDARTNYKPITADNVNVKYMNFHLQNNCYGDSYMPRVTITLLVSPKGSGLDNFDTPIQTTISTRTSDGDIAPPGAPPC